MPPASPPPLGRLIDRLRQHAPLGADDAAALLALPTTARVLEHGGYVVREGDKASVCAVLVSGYAFRQKLTGDGARQIVSLHIPGEALDFPSLFIARADHSVQALTRCELAIVPCGHLHALLRARPAIQHAIATLFVVEASIAREWQLNIGRRDARASLAHLLCEFAVRLDAQGLRASGDGYELPMTQEQLGDALGLTAVHVNRTLRWLEGEGLVRREGRFIAFPDWRALARAADFSALYLHLDNNSPVP